VSVDKANKSDVEVFLNDLKVIGLSINKFCQELANDENISDDDVEYEKSWERYKKRLDRRSISVVELRRFTHFLVNHELFMQSQKIYLESAKGLFQDKEFERELLIAFSEN
jgi:hypothetical protein